MKKNKINPFYISGLVHADGSFNVTTRRKDKYLWLTPRFMITQHKRDINLLYKIKEEFNNIGFIKIDNKNIARYTVSNLDELINIIIPFFLKFKIRGDKYNSFLKFKIIVETMYKKEHYILNNKTGKRSYKVLLNLINLAYSINPLENRIYSQKELLRYLDENDKLFIINDYLKDDNDNEIKTLFNNELIKYPYPKNEMNIDFIKGLFDGDGNITSYISKNKYNNPNIRMTFSIVQDIHNILVLEELKEFFGCGNIYHIGGKAYRYDVKSLNNISIYVLPKLNIKDEYIKYINNNIEIIFPDNYDIYSIKLVKLYYAKEIINLRNKYGPIYVSDYNNFNHIITLSYNILRNDNNISKKDYCKSIYNKFTTNS